METPAVDLIFTITTPPAHGDAFFTDNRVTYTPDPGYTGQDEFEYTASDGEATSPVTRVVIAVQTFSGAPFVFDEYYTGVEDTPLTETPSIVVPAGMVDLTFTLVNAPLKVCFWCSCRCRCFRRR